MRKKQPPQPPNERPLGAVEWVFCDGAPELKRIFLDKDEALTAMFSCSTRNTFITFNIPIEG